MNFQFFHVILSEGFGEVAGAGEKVKDVPLFTEEKPARLYY